MQPQQADDSHASERAELVRSRWSPKPEQIQILESIFNSGMVNPPRHETVRIRKLLEPYGAVGDANVFYWFQNRRSRSRRRQRQLQAGLLPAGTPPASSPAVFASPSSSSHCAPAASSSYGAIGDQGLCSLFPASDQTALPSVDQIGLVSSSSSMPWPLSEASNLNYQLGFMTVFINGVASEVPDGPLDIRTLFGPNVVLVHSSGNPVAVNEFGVSLHSLLMGESYFLVSACLFLKTCFTHLPCAIDTVAHIMKMTLARHNLTGVDVLHALFLWKLISHSPFFRRSQGSPKRVGLPSLRLLSSDLL